MFKNLKNKLKNRKKGFSLIEMVVVIAIMAILALIMVPNLTAYIQKGDDAQIKANIKNVHTAAELTIQADPRISVKDIPFTSRGSAFKTDIGKEIAKYANVDASKIVFSALGSEGTVEGVYYISPTAEGKIQVTMSSDRKTYKFNGTGYTETVITAPAPTTP
jgi:prepilin-type N-terminal cleavage/methylation domain-containing protein